MTYPAFTTPWLRDMVRKTLFEPRAAAAQLFEDRPNSSFVWTWLALVAVLNGIVYSLTLPAQPEMRVIMPVALQGPVMLSVFIFVMMAMMAWFFVRAGRIVGGQGAFAPMLLAVAWLQSLRLALQIAVVLLTLAAPGIGALIAMIAGIWSLYILANFLAEIHGFSTPFRSIAVMVLALLGMAFALTLILTLFGVGPANFPAEIQ